MNNQNEVKELKNQNERKNKTVGKTGEISSKFPGKTGRNFETYQKRMLLAKMDL